MHHHAAETADLFIRNFTNPDESIDSRLMRDKEQQLEENRHVVLAVEFLAKQALPFRGQKDFQIDFSKEDSNRENFIGTLQFMAKGGSILHKHLLTAKKEC